MIDDDDDIWDSPVVEPKVEVNLIAEPEVEVKKTRKKREPKEPKPPKPPKEKKELPTLINKHGKVVFRKGQCDKAREIISRCVNFPIWPRDLAAFKQLMKRYDFKYLSMINKKVDSFTWFLTPYQEKYLTNLRYMILYKEPEKKPQIVCGEDNLGEDVNINKAMNVKDFLS